MSARPTPIDLLYLLSALQASTLRLHQAVVELTKDIPEETQGRVWRELEEMRRLNAAFQAHFDSIVRDIAADR